MNFDLLFSVRTVETSAAVDFLFFGFLQKLAALVIWGEGSGVAVDFGSGQGAVLESRSGRGAGFKLATLVMGVQR